MRYRITRWVIVALVAVLGFLYISRPSAVAQVPDTRYYVSTVMLTGPASLPASGSSNYTVAITVARNGTALNVGVDGTVELRDGNTVLASKTFTVLRNTNNSTVTFPLQCTGGNVAGATASSGRNSVSLTAHVNETDSAPLAVSCGGAVQGGC